MPLQEHIDLVRTNFQYVFKDIMDLDHFEENMLFSDPISKSPSSEVLWFPLHFV